MSKRSFPASSPVDKGPNNKSVGSEQLVDTANNCSLGDFPEGA